MQKELLDVIEYSVRQHIRLEPDGVTYFSGFVSANAEAIRVLIEHGRMSGEVDGRVAFGKFLKD